MNNVVSKPLASVEYTLNICNVSEKSACISINATDRLHVSKSHKSNNVEVAKFYFPRESRDVRAIVAGLTDQIKNIKIMRNSIVEEIKDSVTEFINNNIVETLNITVFKRAEIVGSFKSMESTIIYKALKELGAEKLGNEQYFKCPFYITIEKESIYNANEIPKFVAPPDVSVDILNRMLKESEERASIFDVVEKINELF